MKENNNIEILNHDIKIIKEGDYYILEKKQKIKHKKINIVNMIIAQKEKIKSINLLIDNYDDSVKMAISAAKKEILNQLDNMKKERTMLMENIKVWEKEIGKVNLPKEIKTEV